MSITDALNRVETKRFNVAGYVIEHTDALGQKVRIERGMDDNLVAAKTGPCGCTEEQYEYDDRGNVTKSTDRLGGVRRMEYEPVFNKLTKITDELGRVTTFSLRLARQHDLAHRRARPHDFITPTTASAS